MHYRVWLCPSLSLLAAQALHQRHVSSRGRLQQSAHTLRRSDNRHTHSFCCVFTAVLLFSALCAVLCSLCCSLLSVLFSALCAVLCSLCCSLPCTQPFLSDLSVRCRPKHDTGAYSCWSSPPCSVPALSLHPRLPRAAYCQSCLKSGHTLENHPRPFCVYCQTHDHNLRDCKDRKTRWCDRGSACR